MRMMAAYARASSEHTSYGVISSHAWTASRASSTSLATVGEVIGKGTHSASRPVVRDAQENLGAPMQSVDVAAFDAKYSGRSRTSSRQHCRHTHSCACDCA